MKVRTQDLGEALDYLEGLVLVLRRLQQERNGGLLYGDLMTLLTDLGHGEDLRAVWTPMRYEDGAGEGFGFVADNLEALRAQLVEAYSDAAL